MRRAALFLSGTAAALVALLSYQTPASSVATGTVAVADLGTGAAAVSGTTVTAGSAVDTRWGPVQVAAVTDAAGRLVGVQVLAYPDSNRRDLEINSRALPLLEQEALAAQSAQVDVVSGATYTSEGYALSLQSALDRL